MVKCRKSPPKVAAGVATAIQRQQDLERRSTRRTTRFAARGFPRPYPASEIVGPFRRLLSEFVECFAVTLVRGALRRLEFLASLGMIDGRHDKPAPVRADIERGLRIDL